MICRWSLFRRFIHLPSSKMVTRNTSLRGLFRNVPITVPNELEIKLTPEEDTLCTLLDECKQELQRKGEEVECRIAGGWVRDKVSCRLISATL